jgi:hypothetical protein
MIDKRVVFHKGKMSIDQFLPVPFVVCNVCGKKNQGIDVNDVLKKSYNHFVEEYHRKKDTRNRRKIAIISSFVMGILVFHASSNIIKVVTSKTHWLNLISVLTLVFGLIALYYNLKMVNIGDPLPPNIEEGEDKMEFVDMDDMEDNNE